MFTSLENSILYALSRQPITREDLADVLSSEQYKSVRGVKRVVTRLKKGGLLSETEGIATITPEGLRSITTQSEGHGSVQRLRMRS